MPSLSDAVEWVVKRISALTRTATDADLTDSEYMAVDDASAYTRKITVASLATWILGKIKSLATTITAFRTGDVIPVDGPSGTAKMPAENLAMRVVQDGLAESIAPAFQKNKAGGYYVDDVVTKDGILYRFVARHLQGVDWDDNDVQQTNIEDYVFLKDWSSNKGRTISVTGRGSSQIVRRFACPCNATIIVTPSATTWATTEVVADSDYIFIVRYKDENDVATNGIGWKKSDGSIPSKIKFSIPQNAKWLDFWIRADTGVALSFVVEYDEGAKEVSTDAFEYGTINMTSSALTYGKSKTTSRARFRKGVMTSLDAGDDLVLESGGRMYIAYSADGNPPYTVQGWVKKFVPPIDCKASILLSLDPESSAPLSDIVSKLKIYSKKSELVTQRNAIAGVPFKKNELNDTGRVVLSGNDQTAVTYDIYPKAGSTICFVLDKTMWNVSNVSTASVKLGIRNVRDSDGETEDLITWTQTRIPDRIFYVTIPTDSRSADIFFRADVGESLGITYHDAGPKNLAFADNRSAIVRSVNHRGWYQAPENTLLAFRQSALQGFGIVETDIRKTADGHYVCIHDASVDRTSNGTGNVADMTLTQLKALDFGSWKNVKYTGTTIPTIEEFLACARNLGLEVYLELKDLADTDIPELKKIVSGYGMLNRTTWVGFDWDLMQDVLTTIPSARVGFLCGNITDELVGIVSALDGNVFIDADSSLDSAELNRVKSAGIPLEVWTTDDRYAYNTADPYISGFTSDEYISARVLYQKEIAIQ